MTATYPDINVYTGKLREKCSKCHKVVFHDEDAATRAAGKIAERCAMTPYYNSRCGFWHLTRGGKAK